jgi:hypothetical protein
MRQERLLNRVSTPKTERLVDLDSIIKKNSSEEHARQEPFKIPSKPDLKLVFSKESRPRSALRGQEENKELIQIAENTANLFNCRKNASGSTPCASRKKFSICLPNEVKNGSSTQRNTCNRIENKVPKPVIKSNELLRKYLKK